jgi:hypothetical protein
MTWLPDTRNGRVREGNRPPAHRKAPVRDLEAAAGEPVGNALADGVAVLIVVVQLAVADHETDLVSRRIG